MCVCVKTNATLRIISGETLTVVNDICQSGCIQHLCRNLFWNTQFLCGPPNY